MAGVCVIALAGAPESCQISPKIAAKKADSPVRHDKC